MRAFCFVYLTIGLSLYTSQAQEVTWDTILVQYQIIHQECTPSYDIIKIKVPPFLSTAEVMEQIRLLLFFPGHPPPKKEIRVYVFKETDPIGSWSKTGCIYKPHKGIFWDLRDWKPDSSWIRMPTEKEINIYNVYLDSLFRHGVPYTDSTMDLKMRVARHFKITPSQLDTIYYRVKLWQDALKRQRYRQRKMQKVHTAHPLHR